MLELQNVNNVASSAQMEGVECVSPVLFSQRELSAVQRSRSSTSAGATPPVPLGVSEEEQRLGPRPLDSTPPRSAALLDDGQRPAG